MKFVAWYSVFQRVSTSLVSLLALLCVSIAYADTYVNRPGTNDFDEAVEKGTWIRNAINERRLALNETNTLSTYCGTRLEYFQSLQGHTESLVTEFVGHTYSNPPNPVGRFDGVYYDWWDPPDIFFDLTTWRTVAGLNTNGFRRATEWDGTNLPTFYYGTAQNGDIIAYWIYEDLKAGHGALKWTCMESLEHASLEERYNSTWDTDCPTAYDNSIADFYAASWTSREFTHGVYFAKAVGGHPDINYVFNNTRYKGKGKVSSVNTNRPCSADVYLVPEQSSKFWDVDSLNMNENEMWFFESLPSGSVTTRLTSVCEPAPIAPIINAGVNCTNLTIRECYVQQQIWIMKWDFEYVDGD